jgi:uncharacterized YigZ family protein
MSYWIPSHTTEIEYEIKRSRFIAYARHCTQASDFKDFLNKIKSQHPKASHHCYAFLLSNPQDSKAQGASDDGEPSGTAGQPMLKALIGYQVEEQPIGEVAVIVARYFGGIKLGTGGLARAYAQGIREALDPMPFKLFIPTTSYWLIGPYDKESALRRFLLDQDIKITNVDYQQQVLVNIQLPTQLNQTHFEQSLPYPWISFKPVKS